MNEATKRTLEQSAILSTLMLFRETNDIFESITRSIAASKDVVNALEVQDMMSAFYSQLTVDLFQTKNPKRLLIYKLLYGDMGALMLNDFRKIFANAIDDDDDLLTLYDTVATEIVADQELLGTL